MLRKAGEIMAEYIRNRKLEANRRNRIGSGAYGIVYESDVPGNVMKEVIVPESKQNYSSVNSLKEETDLQAIAAEMGMAPRVAGLEQFPGGVGNRMEMADVRENYEPHGGLMRGASGALVQGWPEGMDAVRVNQQLGQLALKGVRLEDRHNGNIRYNKTTGRPMQLDFGIAGRVEGSKKAATLAMVTSQGFEAAGIPEMGNMLRGIVIDYLEGGQVEEAMDVAKQGFSRLQKIKKVAPS